MLSVDEALAVLDAHRVPQQAEDIPLASALGRTLAADLRANHSVPASASSSMDGYAVRSADLSGGAVDLRVIGEAPAGQPFARSVQPCEAVRIFTGGHVPHGADQIVIQEDAVRDGDHVQVRDPAAPGRYIRGEGIDFERGDVLLRAGRQLGPADIAIAAAGDHATVTAVRRPRIAIIANGNELRLPGSPAQAGSVVASNAFGLAALLTRWGADATDCGIVPDDVDAICRMVETVRDADIIVPVGGASVGDYDYMRAAFGQLGLTQSIAKVAVRPGKPTWFGMMGDQRVLGLPGNPASAYVCAHLFLRTLMAGSGALKWAEAHIAHDVDAEGPREAFLRARMVTGKPGYAQLLPNQDSSLIAPLAAADCLVRRRGGAPAIAAGDTVTILLLQA